MEKSKRNVAALLYVTTSPHLPRTQTRIKPTKSLPEHHHSLWGLVGCPHHCGSTRCWMCCSNQFTRYVASGSTTFLLGITMYNVDICRAVHQWHVNRCTTMSPDIFERMTMEATALTRSREFSRSLFYQRERILV